MPIALNQMQHVEGREPTLADITITVAPGTPESELLRIHAIFPDASFVPPPAVTAPPSLEDALAKAFASAGSLPGDLVAAITAAGGARLFATIAVILVAAFAVERLLALVAFRTPGGADPDAAPGSFRERLPRALRYFVVRLLELAVFAVVALLAARALLAGDEARQFARDIVAAVFFGRFLFLFVQTNAAPRAPERRLMGFTEEEAGRVARAGLLIAVIAAFANVLRGVVTLGVGTDPVGELARIAIVLVLGLATIGFFLAIRGPVTALIVRSSGGPEAGGGGQVSLARHTITVYIVLVFFDMTVKAMGALGLLGPGAAAGSGSTVFLLVVAPLVMAGLRLWAAELGPAERKPVVLAGFALAEGVVVVGVAALLFMAWGIDPMPAAGQSGIAALVPRVFEAAIVVVVGIAAWRAILVLLSDHEEGDEGGKDTATTAEHGEMPVGAGSRMDTILPILRGAALPVVVLITAFTALIALGVNVTPLLASAGVLGLAIGFGAQSLVTDIISGVFYLYEDALRVGEYIETDAGNGAVERITLRSATLRDSRGPIVTVPFSKMGTIRNNSRDFAVMKFSFRVPADTDVEMVRKLIKNVGTQMSADPELADKIIAPLKSQGAIAITGRSYEIGCKFTAVPGQQFALRRKALAMVQKALNEKGITLAGHDLDMGALVQRTS